MNISHMPSQRSISGTAGVCEFCGCPIDEAMGVDVVVPDSGYLHRDDPRHDGNRPTRVCSSNHARELIADGNRQWADAQFWANKLIRVAGHWNREELDDIAERAGLTRSQLARALHWQRSRPARRFLRTSSGSVDDDAHQREQDDLAEYVDLIAYEYERARHVLDRFPKVYEDQLDELRNGVDAPRGHVPGSDHK